MVLVILAFLAPFSVRGARLALEGMKNNVKDWLPSDYPETEELDWFRDHFLSEQFIVISWDGCHPGSEELELFLSKLERWTEHPDLVLHATGAEGDHLGIAGEDGTTAAVGEEIVDVETLTDAERHAREVGWEYKLFTPDAADYHLNWGGHEEKWLLGKEDRWFYITPEGNLYRWTGNDTPFGALYRQLSLLVSGDFKTPGEHVATVDAKYYEDPRQMCAPLFKRVVTGQDLLGELTRPGGPLVRPNDGEEEKIAAYDLAYDRLAGIVFGETLTAPGPDGEFGTEDDITSPGPDGKLGTADDLTPAGPDGKLGTPDDLVGPGPDGEFGTDDDMPLHTTCIVVTLTPAGGDYLSRCVGRGMLGKETGVLYRLAHESGIITDLSEPEQLESLRLGGPPCDNVAIDEEGTITLFNLVGYSILLGFTLSYLCFRSVRITMMIFVVGGLSAISSVAIVWWLGSSVDAILMSMPSLVYVLGLSGAVHIVNYYKDAVEHTGLEGAPEMALRHGWGPCTLAAFTTAIGLLSLNTSHLIPIEKFGTFSAIGVVASLLLLFLFLPAALQLWPPKSAKTLKEEAKEAKPAGDSRVQMAFTNFWKRIGAFSVRHNGMMCAAGLVILIVCALGLLRINTSVQLIKLFDNDAKLIHDYTWLEKHIGNLVPVEVVVKVDADSSLRTALEETAPVDEEGRSSFQERSKLRFVDELRLTSRIQSSLESEFGPEGHNVAGRGMSVATFSPPLLEPGSNFNGAFSRRLEANVEELIGTDYLRYDKEDGSSLWRVSMRLGALNDVDYGMFVAEMEGVVEPILQGYNERIAVLQAVEASRPEVGFAGGNVLVLGAPIKEAAPEPEVTEVVAESKPHEVDQSQLFYDSLLESLVISGVHPTSHDRVAFPLDEQTAVSEEWGQYLAQFDAVVILEEDNSYKLDFIRDNARQLVDLTDHGFDPGDTTANAAGAPLAAVYTGIVPIVYKAQRELLESLVWSVATAFLLIAVVMMVLLRGVRAGLTSMIPNVFPVVLVFGLMGWADIIVDIGSMMTASVAMGIAVDDTIHFLTWFRRGLDEGLDRRGAIMQAYDRCAAAMTETTLIGGLGLSVFALSTFTPTQRFGVLMLALLVAALVGDLVLMPALLASPLGNVFKPKKKKPQQGESPAEATPGSEESLAQPTAATANVDGSATLSAPPPQASSGGGHHLGRKLRSDSRHSRPAE